MEQADRQDAEAAKNEIHVVFDANALITACKFAVEQNVVIDLPAPGLSNPYSRVRCQRGDILTILRGRARPLEGPT